VVPAFNVFDIWKPYDQSKKYTHTWSNLRTSVSSCNNAYTFCYGKILKKLLGYMKNKHPMSILRISLLSGGHRKLIKVDFQTPWIHYMTPCIFVMITSRVSN
jgi:hypothetical protein